MLGKYKISVRQICNKSGLIKRFHLNTNYNIIYPANETAAPTIATRSIVLTISPPKRDEKC